MRILTNFIANLPSMLLSLPMVLLALSAHEAAHGYAAYKLGDPTARNFGRLTLNPLKHLHPWGFLCMLLFRFGWANPVPINTRNFKKPRRDMALSAAAGPVSNVLLSLIMALLLRLDILLVEQLYGGDLYAFAVGVAEAPVGFKLLSVLTYILYTGVVLNISLAVFNLIPVPPFDGSRIAHVFLPPKWYFKIMRYEQYIMYALLLICLFTADFWLTPTTDWLSTLIMSVFGMGKNSESYYSLWSVVLYISRALTL